MDAYSPHRRRRGTYSLAETGGFSRLIRVIIQVLVLLFIVYVFGGWVLRMLGVGNRLQRAAATLYVENGGPVTVSLEGGEWQRAENAMKIYPGDQVSTGGNGHAMLRFFDESWLRLQERSNLSMSESAVGAKQSALSVGLQSGMAWVSASSPNVFSGSILRSVSAGPLSSDLPGNTEAVVSPSSLIVYNADGVGLTVTVKGKEPIIIGEGQQLIFPKDTIGDNLYAYRSALDDAALRSAFLLESRKAKDQLAGSGTLAGGSDDVLTVTAPQNNAILAKNVLNVTGNVAQSVQQLLINGHPAPIEADRTFNQQMTPPQGSTDFEVRVQALDKDGNVLGDVRRMVKRAVQGSLPKPAVTSPAQGGQTYRTNKDEIVLRGTAPADATGMMVNDYELKLFDPAKGTWSYLANMRLGNLKPGTNVYDVYALYGDDKKKSDPVRITILAEEGTEGVVAPGSSVTPPAQSPEQLPNNDPLTPGSLKVIAPVEGTSATASGTGTLIEGTTSSATDSIWVNDYKLQLYRPGKQTWNYIASPDLKNMKEGSNVYVIIARDKGGKILDKMTYTIEYQP